MREGDVLSIWRVSLTELRLLAGNLKAAGIPFRQKDDRLMITRSEDGLSEEQVQEAVKQFPPECYWPEDSGSVMFCDENEYPPM